MRAIAFLLLLLTACSNAQTPDQGTIELVSGTWQAHSSKSEGTVKIWPDGAVLIDMTVQQTHLRLLSHLEQDKKGLAFSIGDRWQGPVRLRLEKDALVLIWPSKPPMEIRCFRP